VVVLVDSRLIASLRCTLNQLTEIVHIRLNHRGDDR